MSVLKELWQFMRASKKFWLLFIMLVMALLVIIRNQFHRFWPMDL